MSHLHPHRIRASLLAAATSLVAVLGACSAGDSTAPGPRPATSSPHTPTPPTPPGPTPSTPTSTVVDSIPVFHANGRPLGHPAMALLVDGDGTPRVRSQADYDHFWSSIAPLLGQWALDAKLNINPNFVAAIVTQESGFDSLAVSWMPANGLTQMTSIADQELVQTAADPVFQWIQSEVQGWPRSPLVHSGSPTHDQIVAALGQGTLTSSNEYFFNPQQVVRGTMLWLRILETKWTVDEWPGAYGSFARAKLNGGAPLTEQQLFELVTVSYNQGYPFVQGLVDRYGTQWTAVLAQQGAGGAEGADYLHHVRQFTAVYQTAASQAASGH